MGSATIAAPSLAESEELSDLRATLRRMLASAAPESIVREHLDSVEGYDRAIWRRLATEIGMQGLAIPEQYGGAGCGLRELVVAGEELGRTLCPGPFLSTVLLAATLVTSSEDRDAMASILPGIAAGTLVASVAVPGHGSGGDPRDTTVTAVHEGDAWRLTGTVQHVLDGQVADVLLVPARHDGGLVSFFKVTPVTTSTSVQPVLAMDQTRRFARIDLASAPATLLGSSGTAAELNSRATDIAAVGLAADQVGGARRMLEVTTEYAVTRYQFGRPIGSFQAVKHALADMLISTELARAALEDGVRAVEQGAEDLVTAVSAARIVCSEAYYDVAATAIQIHGGLGFTWEHSAHLYFKRATADRILLGSPAHHAGRLAAALEL